MSPSDAGTRPAPRDDRRAPRDPLLLLVGAGAVLVSGYVHYYLYFKGGYRDIAPDSVAGLWSRSSRRSSPSQAWGRGSRCSGLTAERPYA